MQTHVAKSDRRTWCFDVGMAGASFFLTGLWPLCAAAPEGLEGRRFDTQAGLAGKPAHVPSDILSFAAGLFHSADCDQYQYAKGRYTSAAETDGSVRFEVETISPSYGRNVWSGRVRGRSIEGEFVFHRKATWWRQNPEPLTHWFKGHEIDTAGKPLS